MRSLANLKLIALAGLIVVGLMVQGGGAHAAEHEILTAPATLL